MSKVETVSTPKRKAIDWQAVERDYRAGIMSLREMAAAHGVSHVSIKKRADKEEWSRDLAAKIQAKADDLVNRREANRQANSSDAVNERVIIEANAERIAQVRGEHRADITRLRNIVLAMTAECEVETADVDLFSRLGELMQSPDDKGVDRLNEIYRKVISLPQRVESVKKLAETLKILIGLEREAYNIASVDDTPPGAKIHRIELVALA